MKTRSHLAVLLALAACRSTAPPTTEMRTTGPSGLERVTLLAKGLE